MKKSQSKEAAKLARYIKKFFKENQEGSFTSTELRKLLKLTTPQYNTLKTILQELVAEKDLNLVKHRFSFRRPDRELLTGIIKVHPRGFGFVQPKDPAAYPEDIFIPKHLTAHSVDGDRVEVEINQNSVSERGPEGKVTTILERGRTHLAGIIYPFEPHGPTTAYVPLLGVSKPVYVEEHDELQLNVGDRIIMEVIDWAEHGAQTLCRATHCMGHISDPSVDVHAAIEEYELHSNFPQTVVAEAENFGNRVSNEEIKKREDLRDLETFTIDPDTAKDFDDALSLSKDKKGNYQLAVHIADVSHYVTPGSALDQEAKERCNSTYFPGTCIPMLPHELSSNLCSLKPNVNRLTVSIIATLDSSGNITNYRFARSVIKSDKRFTYREAKEILDGKKRSPHKKTLKLMEELCLVLKEKRYARGSLEFAIPELSIIVDEKGSPTGTDYIEYDITHQLVEEFMLLSNELVAKHLTEEGQHMSYRVHEEPAAENLKDFALLVGAFGFELSETPDAHELQVLFEEVQSTSYGHFLASCYIRRMRMAVYAADNIGHYGLQLGHYCHFTSPIRRYIDLVIHRILMGEASDRDALTYISTTCSEQERISAKAEMSVKQLKKLRLLKKWQKKDPYKIYNAVITQIKPFGIFFEILDLMLEGFVHISEVGEDFYHYDEANLSLEGEFYGAKLYVGDKIEVILKEINFILQESRWSLASSPEMICKPKKKKKKKKGRRK